MPTVSRWSFLDGPITANNPMGVHHAWGRSLKDMYQRYHAMSGRALRYQNGFDCQGLWVEVEVEKSLGLKTKREIREFGIEKFVRACKERVLTYAARQTEQSIRLGYWCDWDDPKVLVACATLGGWRSRGHREAAERPHGDGARQRDRPETGLAEYGGSYFTFSDENNYTIWRFLKKCHTEGFIYRGHDVMPWCGRCGTGLSQMEVAEGRRITHAHFGVCALSRSAGRSKTALLVWTTTPWTLTSNVAVAVNPEMTYLKVKHGDWIYYVAKGNFERDRVQDLQVEGKHETHKLPSIRTILKGSGGVEVVEELPGKRSVGPDLRGPVRRTAGAENAGRRFPLRRDRRRQNCGGSSSRDRLERNQRSRGHRTRSHRARLRRRGPATWQRERAFRSSRRWTRAPIFLDGFGQFTGRNANEVADDVVAALKASGMLVAREKYPHVYPHCWRCKEELVFRPVDEWFIRMDWRDRIQRVVPSIKWIPPDGEARELDWLRNMGDWMISKKRFWGLALPIWVCGDCEHFAVIGSREELQGKGRRRLGRVRRQLTAPAVHRRRQDSLREVRRAGARASRTSAIRGSTRASSRFSTMRYSTDRAYWEKWFPADLVLESFPGQFRNWFYSLLAMSAMMDGRAPFKALLGHALVRDARGEEMHKSKGNSIAFDEAAEALGRRSDALHLRRAEDRAASQLSRSASHRQRGPDHRRRCAPQAADVLELLQLFRHVRRRRRLEAGASPHPVTNELDRWILSRLQRLVARPTAPSRTYEHYRFIEAFQEFDDEFSNWYLRRSRRRFWKSEQDAYQTLYTVLTTVTRVMAPALPFLTEEIYQNLVSLGGSLAPESVHLTRYPQVDASLIDEALEHSIEAVIRIKNLALSLRTQSKVKIRQPLEHALRAPQGRGRSPGAGKPGLRRADSRRSQSQESGSDRRRNDAGESARSSRMPRRLDLARESI